MRLQKVKGHPTLMRDANTGAIINTDRTEIAQAKARKQAALQQQERFENLSEEVQSLKTDIDAIKALLTQLVENNK